jgi:MazG family protein
MAFGKRRDPDEDVTWTHVPVGRYVRGAMRLERRDDGLVQPYRFSAAQMETLDELGRAKRSVATAGITIDFVTDGDAISFECKVTRPLDQDNPTYDNVVRSLGQIGEAENGVLDGIDVMVGGHVFTLPAQTGTHRLEIDNPSHDDLEVVIYLPCIMSLAVGDLASTGQIRPAPQRDYLLALGDSITQGFVVGCPSQSWPARVARGLGLDMVNQAIAGYYFDVRTLVGMFRMRRHRPTLILVAYGTNDWAHKGSSKRIEADAKAYFDRLAKLFPGIPVYMLTPLWRGDVDEAMPSGKRLTWVAKMLRRQCKGRKGFKVIDGWAALPHDERLMADQRLHPNSIGTEILADNILDALLSQDDKVLERSIRYAAPVGAATSRPCVSESTDPSSDDVVDEPPEPDEVDPLARVDQETAARADAPTTHPDLDAVIRTIWRLRQPDGCPWDKVQTHASISKNMVEEAYEAVDAIEEGAPAHLSEELGDVLMQVLLHAQIADDDGEFSIDDIARQLDEKLVRRHPHVFGDHAEATSADEVAGIWSDVKLEERRDDTERSVGLLDDVPRALPALMEAQKVSKKAAACGFDWDSTAGVWDKVAEERGEFEAEASGSTPAAEEFGDILFALVNVARKEGIDAEAALRSSNTKFRNRWSAMEHMAAADERDISDLDRDKLEELWQRAKALEVRDPQTGVS